MTVTDMIQKLQKYPPDATAFASVLVNGHTPQYPVRQCQEIVEIGCSDDRTDVCILTGRQRQLDACPITLPPHKGRGEVRARTPATPTEEKEKVGPTMQHICTNIRGYGSEADRKRAISALKKHGYNYFVCYRDVTSQYALTLSKSQWVVDKWGPNGYYIQW